MCRYRYYYFSSCRHQQTVLFDYCSDALSVQQAQCAMSEMTTEGKHDPQHKISDDAGRAGGIMIGAEEGAPNGDNTDLPSLCSTAETRSSHSNRSSFDTGSVSIITEHCVDCSSLRTEQPSYPSPSADSSHSMAGLPLFGDTFRHWMSGGAATPPKQNVSDAKVHTSMSNKRSIEAVSFSDLIPLITHES